MNALVFFAIVALATPIFGEEAVTDVKRQEKRGVVGLGYGGNYLNGLHGLGYGYNGIGHGYLNNLNTPYFLGHSSGVAPAYTAPAYTAPAYTAPAYTAPVARVAPLAPIAPIAPLAPIAPIAPLAPLAHGYNYNHGIAAPLYTAPLRLGHGNLGHNLGYYNPW